MDGRPTQTMSRTNLDARFEVSNFSRDRLTVAITFIRSDERLMSKGVHLHVTCRPNVQQCQGSAVLSQHLTPADLSSMQRAELQHVNVGVTISERGSDYLRIQYNTVHVITDYLITEWYVQQTDKTTKRKVTSGKTKKPHIATYE